MEKTTAITILKHGSNQQLQVDAKYVKPDSARMCLVEIVGDNGLNLDLHPITEHFIDLNTQYSQVSLY